MAEIELLNKGKSCFLVRLNNDYSNVTELFDYFNNHRFVGVIYCSSLPRGSWIYVNIETKTYRYGTIGVAIVGEVVGNHAISVKDFITICDIYNKYQDIKFIEIKK